MYMQTPFYIPGNSLAVFSFVCSFVFYRDIVLVSSCDAWRVPCARKERAAVRAWLACPRLEEHFDRFADWYVLFLGFICSFAGFDSAAGPFFSW